MLGVIALFPLLRGGGAHLEEKQQSEADSGQPYGWGPSGAHQPFCR